MSEKTDNFKNLVIVETNILWSRAKTSSAVSKVEQNRFNSLSNFSAEIFQNRQLINQTTDDIFRDRYNAMKSVKFDDPQAQTYKDLLEAQSRVDVLEHRHKLNQSMLDVAKMMQSINRQLIEVNETLQETNLNLNSFNTKNLEKNNEYLELLKSPLKVTNEEIEAIKVRNRDRLINLSQETSRFMEQIEEFNQLSHKNHADINEQILQNNNLSQEVERTREILNGFHEKLNHFM